MATSAVNLGAGQLVNAVAPGATGAVQATNTCTVTPVQSFDVLLVRVRIIQNHNGAAQGTGTVTLTIVDSASATALTSAALLGMWNTTTALDVPTDFVFAVSNIRAAGASFAAGTQTELGPSFTVVTTVAAGNSGSLVYQVDLLGLTTQDNPLNTRINSPATNIAGSEKAPL